MIRSKRTTGLVYALAAVLAPLGVLAQVTTESRDPNRGVTVFSQEVSADKVRELNFDRGLFSEDDEMAIGVSALFFDESSTVSDYVPLGAA